MIAMLLFSPSEIFPRHFLQLNDLFANGSIFSSFYSSILIYILKQLFASVKLGKVVVILVWSYLRNFNKIKFSKEKEFIAG